MACIGCDFRDLAEGFRKRRAFIGVGPGIICGAGSDQLRRVYLREPVRREGKAKASRGRGQRAEARIARMGCNLGFERGGELPTMRTRQTNSSGISAQCSVARAISGTAPPANTP